MSRRPETRRSKFPSRVAQGVFIDRQEARFEVVERMLGITARGQVALCTGDGCLLGAVEGTGGTGQAAVVSQVVDQVRNVALMQPSQVIDPDTQALVASRFRVFERVDGFGQDADAIRHRLNRPS